MNGAERHRVPAIAAPSAARDHVSMKDPQGPDEAKIRAEIERRAKAAADAMTAGRVQEAARVYAALVRAFPGSAMFHSNLGVCLRRLGRSEAAVASYRRALALAPDEASIHSSLGNALRDLGRIEGALAAQARAFELAPRHQVVRYNLALALRDTRRYEEALTLLRELSSEFPDVAEYAWDLALTQLQTGDYLEGFRGYEARWRLPRFKTPLRDVRQWDGGKITGRRIFLQSEQGFGDAIQFVRYVPRLAQRGAHVVLECAPELQRLFAGVEGVTETVVKGADAPATDFSTPLLSLPRLFAVSLSNLEAKVPYLRAPGTIALPPLATRAEFRVGLVWGGEPQPHDRSWPLRSLAPLFNDPRIAFVSLQKGPHARELARLGFDHVVHDMGPKLNDFADTAAAMEQLNLVVTVDTAAAHLAGALGRPALVLLRYVADWRWLDDRADSPWYPTLRLFRQASPDDFDGPVEAMRAELARMLAGAGAKR
jgi:tetratricopeptide (TPR) repeat protein